MLVWFSLVLVLVVLITAGTAAYYIWSQQTNAMIAPPVCPPVVAGAMPPAIPQKKFAWMKAMGWIVVGGLGVIVLSLIFSIGSCVVRMGSDPTTPPIERRLSRVETAIEKVKRECLKLDQVVKAPAGKDDKGEWLWSNTIQIYDEEATPHYMYTEHDSVEPTMVRLEDGSEHGGNENVNAYSKTLQFRSVDSKEVNVSVHLWRCKAN